MWFAKWFGGRANRGHRLARIAQAPARSATPASPGVPSGRIPSGMRAPVKRVQAEVDGANLSFAPEVKRGFDPYNSSGSFDRNGGWDRIIIGR